MVVLGSKTQKAAEMPTKRGETQQDQGLTPNSFHFHAATGGVGGDLLRILGEGWMVNLVKRSLGFGGVGVTSGQGIWLVGGEFHAL